MPPARCTSSTWYFSVAGATLQMHGTLRERRSMSAIVKSTPASWAMPRMCRIVLVEPPMAMSRVMAFSKASKVAMPRGSTRVVAVDVVRVRHLDDPLAGALEELPAPRVRREDRAVAGQREAERLVQAVHAVRGEHAGAGAAGRAGRALHLEQLGVGDGIVARRDHRVDQVELATRPVVSARRLAGLHRAAGDEDRRDVQTHRREQHARRDLVAVRDADQRVGDVGLDHVLDAVGDQIAGGQRVEHPAVAHRDAVVDGDRVELDTPAAGGVDHLLHPLSDVVEVDVTRYELGEAVGDRDDRLLEVGVGHARGAPERAGSGHVPACGRRAAAISLHGREDRVELAKVHEGSGRPTDADRASGWFAPVCGEGWMSERTSESPGGERDGRARGGRRVRSRATARVCLMGLIVLLAASASAAQEAAAVPERAEAPPAAQRDEPSDESLQAVERAERAAREAATSARVVAEAQRAARRAPARSGAYLGGAFFYAAENFEDRIIVKSSTGGAGFVGYRFGEFFAAEIRYEGFEGFDLKARNGRGEIDGWALTAIAKAYPFVGPVQPFLGFGVGGVRFEQRNVFNDGSRSRADDSSAAFRFGAGLDVWLNESIVLNGEAAYLFPVDDESDLETTILSIGLSYRF